MSMAVHRYQETALICEQGHVITDSLEMHFEFKNYSHCPKCGSRLYTKCPNCQSKIFGQAFTQKTYSLANTREVWQKNTNSKLSSIIEKSGEFSCPSYCYKCGKPYPWTAAIIREFEEVIDLSDELDETEKTILKDNFPFLLQDQPGTTSATLKIAKVLTPVMNTTTGKALQSAIAGKFVGKALELLNW